MTPRYLLRAGLLLAIVTILATARGGAQATGGLIQAGDRVLLRVSGEPTLTDTFTVGDGPSLDLPALGAVSLAGVPRDSIEPHLIVFLRRYLNHPVVRAQVLLRLGILGEVARPGFYALPSGGVLEDLIMTAGGLSQDARFERVRLLREDDVILGGDDVRKAIADGRTFDALALRSGDALQIPRRPDQEGQVRILSALIALPIAVYGLVRLF
jgi:protein involved in polysaccharide export with SLBB domain